MVAIEVPLEKSKPAVATPAAASAVTPVASPAVAPAVSTAASSATKVQSLNTAKPVGEAEESFTINVPNAKGEFTPVKLVKHDKGFIGPQGEFYPDHPTVDELKVLYGK
jgi:hypothetical protein